MAVRRRPAVEADVDEPPPNWTARRVHVWRVATFAPSDHPTTAPYPLAFNARPLDRALEHARRLWAEMTPERRAYWWSIDTDVAARWRGAEPCARHDRPWSMCPPSCPTVKREQRLYNNR